MKSSPRFRSLPLSLALLFGVPSAYAISVIGEGGVKVPASEISPLYDRFSSGYPGRESSDGQPVLTEAPVLNLSPSFIAAGYNLSGVGWSGHSTGLPLTMLNGRYFISAAHRNPLSLSPHAQFLTQSGALHNTTIEWVSGAQGTSGSLGIGDLAIGKLTTALPSAAGIVSYRIAEMGHSSTPSRLNAENPFPRRGMLLYGKYGRMGYTEVKSLRGDANGAAGINFVYGNDIVDDAAAVGWVKTYENGDSGSPAFFLERGELLIAGTAWTYGLSSYIGAPWAAPVVNQIMAADGYALQWTILESSLNLTYSGSNGDLNQSANYVNGSAPNQDASMIFRDREEAHDLTASHHLSTRGIAFDGSDHAAGGYTLQGNGVLTIGYAGIRNRSTAQQRITNAIALAGHQNWESDGGDLLISGTVSKNGYLLSTGGTGRVVLSGRLTGSGGFAKDGTGNVYLNAVAGNDYSGTTWVHEGMLSVNNQTGSGTGTGRVLVAEGGILAGVGHLQGDVELQRGAVLTPGSEGVAGVGTLAITGRLNLNGRIVWNLNADSEESGFDQLVKLGSLRGVNYGEEAEFAIVFGDGVNFSTAFWQEERRWIVLDVREEAFVSGSEVWENWEHWIAAGSFRLLSGNGAGEDLILTFTPVPEPSSVFLMLAGAGGILYGRRKAYR